MPKMKCYLLALAKKRDLKKYPADATSPNVSTDTTVYDSVSEEVRAAIDTFYQGRPVAGSDRCNHDEYCDYECTYGNHNFIARHYKMRLILEWEYDSPQANITALFHDARKNINKVLQDDFLGIKALGEHIGKNTTGSIEYIVYHPLVVIDCDYRSSDFNKLGALPITTFFYEIFDARRTRARLPRALGHPPKTIIRVSRPCVITSSMSKFLEYELINILYDTCLYEKRLKPGKYDDNEGTFNKVKQSIGLSLHDLEASHVNAENAAYLSLLSVVMTLGAVASILALVAADGLAGTVRWIGALLLVCTAAVLVVFFWRSR